MNDTDETLIDQSAQDDPGAPDAGAADAVLRERDALQDRLLRTAAEFDNYRKRIERERREFTAFAAADVLTEILPIVDNLERALQAASGGDGLHTGVELIHKQLLDLLRKRGVTTVDALGADFDPTLHEAVVQEDSTDHREGEVIEQLQRGYKLGDRLLRPAMVKVARHP